MANVYIVQLSYYDNIVTLGAHTSLDRAKEEIDKINSGQHIMCKLNSYGEEWVRFIIIRDLNKDHNDDDENYINEITYRGK